MPHPSFRRLVLPVLALLVLCGPVAVRAQETPPAAAAAATPALTQEQVAAFAKAYVAVAQVRDAVHAELAKTANKTTQAQKQLQDRMREQIAHVLHEHSLTEEEYQRRTYLISTDQPSRKAFDELIAQLTGQPTPGQQIAQPQGGPQRGGGAAPAVQTSNPHVGHVVNAFNDTPNGQGLLPTALAEARTAAQHASLAARNPGNLESMKTHAGHVLHAVDPSVAPSGPGQGYGVKKAAAAVAAHIELAARAPGASQAVTTHAMHIATSARNTVQRADRIVALIKQIQAATSAEDAATLLNQLVPLTEQLIAGADANSDGRIGWQDGEGGLQHVEEHVNLLLRADG